ncbi:MAG TPA: hypothetical protein VK348_10225 [Planctomycetota bacterium]|nr:hypothetical protein [Planctomycetota bacterium]
MSKHLGESMRLEDDHTVEVIEELHLTQRQQMQSVRNLASRVLAAAVTIAPASPRERERTLAKGMTRELKVQEIVATLDRPVGVGDCVWLAVDRAALDLMPSLALCVGCAMLADDEYEARFQLLQVTALPPGALHLSG